MINKNTVIRIARHTNDLEITAKMYKDGLGFEILSEFRDHDGYDGIILGNRNSSYHLEFTRHENQSGNFSPPEDNFLVFYIHDKADYNFICSRLELSGFKKVKSSNPFWDKSGSTFEDPEEYRIVIYNGKWVK
jgi:hypothetical protein